MQDSPCLFKQEAASSSTIGNQNAVRAYRLHQSQKHKHFVYAQVYW